MAPKHLRGEEPGFEARVAGPSAPPSARAVLAPREGGRGDTDFMEEIVRELSAQNEIARASSGVPSTRETPVSGAVAAAPDTASSMPSRGDISGEQIARPRTVRVDRDSGFRTPEGVASARAYLPVKTVAPGRSAEVEIETVKVSDPRRLPTVRIDRERRVAREGSDTARSGRRPRAASPDDSAPTLRSAPGLKAEPKSAPVSFWVGAVVLAAVVGILVVALAARLWPGPPDPPPSPQPDAAPTRPAAAERGAPAPHVSTDAPPGATAGPAPVAATAQPAASGEASARAPATTRSDRWF